MDGWVSLSGPMLRAQDGAKQKRKKLSAGDGSGAALPSVSLSTPSASEGLATGTDKAERQERSAIEREERRGRKEEVVSARVIHFWALSSIVWSST